MKYSLLELVQSIFSSMDSEEVDSITDTTEARQVAEIVRTAYFNIIARAHLPEHKGLFQLTASGTSLKPVLMTRPTTIRHVEWIKYRQIDVDADIDQYKYVTILPIDQYM